MLLNPGFPVADQSLPNRGLWRSLQLSVLKYADVLKGLKKEAVLRYSGLLYRGCNKMCRISFVPYVEMQEGLGRWGE